MYIYIYMVDCWRGFYNDYEGYNYSNVGKTMSLTTHLGMVNIAHKNGDDWGMVYYCFNHIICLIYIILVLQSDPFKHQFEVT